MKRITVQVVLADGYYSTNEAKKIKAAMINAAVAKATELNTEIASIDTKIGHVHKR